MTNRKQKAAASTRTCPIRIVAAPRLRYIGNELLT